MNLFDILCILSLLLLLILLLLIIIVIVAFIFILVLLFLFPLGNAHVVQQLIAQRSAHLVSEQLVVEPLLAQVVAKGAIVVARHQAARAQAQELVEAGVDNVHEARIVAPGGALLVRPVVEAGACHEQVSRAYVLD